MDNVFITGESGFLGKHLFERLHKTKNIYLYERDEGMSGLKSFDPEYIFHLAGEIYDESKMFDSNIKLTFDLLETSKRLTRLKAFIYIGSSSEYGRKTQPMREEDFLDPTNLYEASKGASSLLCQAYAREHGIPAMIARPFSLYGKYEPEKRFIPTLIRSAKAGWEMKIAPGVHDFIHIDDFIDGLLMLCDTPKPGEIYNFGSGFQLSNDDVVEIVEEVVKRKVISKLIPKLHDYDSDCWVADINKAKNLGWSPKISFYEGIMSLCRHS